MSQGATTTGRGSRIVFVGESHTYAIQKALVLRKERGESADIEAYVYSKVKNGREYGDLSVAAIDDLVASLTHRDLLVSTVGGNQHAVLSLVQHSVPFDIMLPGAAPAPGREGAVLVPYAQMKAEMARLIALKDEKRLRSLKSLTKATMVHVVAPPPKADGELLRRLAFPGALFMKMGFAERGISPPSLRMKLWELQCAVLREIAADLKIGLLFPPTEVLDADGFLTPGYSAADASHANARYGERVLRQVQAYRRSLRQVAVAA